MSALAMRWLALEVAALCGPEKPSGKEPTELRCTRPLDHMPHVWHADFPGVYGDWLCPGIGPPSPLVGGKRTLDHYALPIRPCQSACDHEPHFAHSWFDSPVQHYWCEGFAKPWFGD
jgi:hypothetical protein